LTDGGIDERLDAGCWRLVGEAVFEDKGDGRIERLTRPLVSTTERNIFYYPNPIWVDISHAVVVHALENTLKGGGGIR
jgi:hypothetical protein